MTARNRTMHATGGAYVQRLPTTHRNAAIRSMVNDEPRTHRISHINKHLGVGVDRVVFRTISDQENHEAAGEHEHTVKMQRRKQRASAIITHDARSPGADRHPSSPTPRMWRETQVSGGSSTKEREVAVGHCLISDPTVLVRRPDPTAEIPRLSF